MARIILVDDDPVIGRIITDALFRAGHAAGWVADGEAALKLMRSRPPHLAILDCAMPGLSGVQMVRAMRGDGGLCAIPILMLTARCAESDERLAFAAGADDYLRKPVDLDKLAGRVEALLIRAAPLRRAG